MSQEFDPYFTWLKIPPSEQPPNHYRLLNTARFESDPEIIESAVARLVTLLQNVSTGDKAEHAQKILNDVAKARLCLSDPQRKAEYDKQLAKKIFGSGKGMPVKKPVRAQDQPKSEKPRDSTPKRPPPVGKVRSGSKTTGKKKGPSTAGKRPSSKPKPQKVGSSAGLIIGYAVAILLVACVALFFLFQHLSNNQTASHEAAMEASDENWQEDEGLETGAFEPANLSDGEETAGKRHRSHKIPERCSRCWCP